MEINKLATDLTIFLTPFLPFLLTGTTEAFKAMGKNLGEATSNKARVLWKKIWSSCKKDQTDQTLENFAEALSKNQNKIFQASLAQIIANHLENHSPLAEELNNLIIDDKAIQNILIEHGSEVDDIMQEMFKSGEQEIIIRGSKTGKLLQKQQ